MTNHTDILLDPDFDLLDHDGDMVTGDVIYQQQALLIATGEGEWKQSPGTGVGLDLFLLDESDPEVTRKIRQQFRSDGLQPLVIKKSTDGNLIIQSKHA